MDEEKVTARHKKYLQDYRNIVGQDVSNEMTGIQIHVREPDHRRDMLINKHATEMLRQKASDQQ